MLSKEFLKKRIVPIDIEGIDTISGMLSAFNNTSFQSRNLARCVEIFTKMLEDPDEPTIFLGLAGVMVPAACMHEKYGLVAEAHGYMDQRALKEILEWKIREMAKIRQIEINEIGYRFENLRVPMDNYGCVVAALVYIP